MPKISDLTKITNIAENDELPIVDVDEYTTKKISVGQIIPVGSIIDFAGTAPPNGWLLCYGQTLDASINPKYQALYNVIGNIYGGTSYSDFVVPDLRGRVTPGKDNMGGTSANRLTSGLDGDILGMSGGGENTTLSNSNLPRYSGTVVIHGAGGATVISSVGGTGLSSGIVRGQYRSGGTNTAGANSVDSFSLDIGQSTPTPVSRVQPVIILNKIIRY